MEVGVENKMFTDRNFNFYHTYLANSFGSVNKDETFMDVVFICRDNICVKCHKVVLASVSHYLKEIIDRCNLQETVYISVPDVTYSQLNVLLSFLYKGESIVNNQELNDLEDILLLFGIYLPNAFVSIAGGTPPLVTVKLELQDNVDELSDIHDNKSSEDELDEPIVTTDSQSWDEDSNDVVINPDEDEVRISEVTSESDNDVCRVSEEVFNITIPETPDNVQLGDKEEEEEESDIHNDDTTNNETYSLYKKVLKTSIKNTDDVTKIPESNISPDDEPSTKNDSDAEPREVDMQNSCNNLEEDSLDLGVEYEESVNEQEYNSPDTDTQDEDVGFNSHGQQNAEENCSDVVLEENSQHLDVEKENNMHMDVEKENNMHMDVEKENNMHMDVEKENNMHMDVEKENNMHMDVELDENSTYSEAESVDNSQHSCVKPKNIWRLSVDSTHSWHSGVEVEINSPNLRVEGNIRHKSVESEENSLHSDIEPEEVELNQCDSGLARKIFNIENDGAELHIDSYETVHGITSMQKCTAENIETDTNLSTNQQEKESTNNLDFEDENIRSASRECREKADVRCTDVTHYNEHLPNIYTRDENIHFPKIIRVRDLCTKEYVCGPEENAQLHNYYNRYEEDINWPVDNYKVNLYNEQCYQRVLNHDEEMETGSYNFNPQIMSVCSYAGNDETMNMGHFYGRDMRRDLMHDFPEEMVSYSREHKLRDIERFGICPVENEIDIVTKDIEENYYYRRREAEEMKRYFDEFKQRESFEVGQEVVIDSRSFNKEIIDEDDISLGPVILSTYSVFEEHNYYSRKYYKKKWHHHYQSTMEELSSHTTPADDSSCANTPVAKNESDTRKSLKTPEPCNDFRREENLLSPGSRTRRTSIRKSGNNIGGDDDEVVKRISLTDSQKDILEGLYNEYGRIPHKLRLKVAEDLELPLKFIVKWFSNKRYRDDKGQSKGSSDKKDSPSASEAAQSNERYISNIGSAGDAYKKETKLVNKEVEHNKLESKNETDNKVSSTTVENVRTRKLTDKKTLNNSAGKRRRSILTDFQRNELERLFIEHGVVRKLLRLKIAKDLDLSVKFVGNWFMNRKYKQKKVPEVKVINNKKVPSRKQKKKKGPGGRVLTQEQREVLESAYKKNRFPNAQVEKKLSTTLGISVEFVNKWFYKRRDQEDKGGSKWKGYEVVLNESSKLVLERKYNENKLGSEELRRELAEKLQLPLIFITQWYENRQDKSDLSKEEPVESDTEKEACKEDKKAEVKETKKTVADLLSEKLLPIAECSFSSSSETPQPNTSIENNISKSLTVEIPTDMADSCDIHADWVQQNFPNLSQPLASEKSEIGYIPFIKRRAQLEAAYCENQFPDEDRQQKLAEETGLTVDYIKNWFTTKRYRDVFVQEKSPTHKTLDDKVETSVNKVEEVKPKVCRQNSTDKSREPPALQETKPSARTKNLSKSNSSTSTSQQKTVCTSGKGNSVDETGNEPENSQSPVDNAVNDPNDSDWKEDSSSSEDVKKTEKAVRTKKRCTTRGRVCKPWKKGNRTLRRVSRKGNTTHTEILYAAYLENKFPSIDEYRKLSKTVGLSLKYVRTWFINRRYKDKKEGVLSLPDDDMSSESGSSSQVKDPPAPQDTPVDGPSSQVEVPRVTRDTPVDEESSSATVSSIVTCEDSVDKIVEDSSATSNDYQSAETKNKDSNLCVKNNKIPSASKDKPVVKQEPIEENDTPSGSHKPKGGSRSLLSHSQRQILEDVFAEDKYVKDRKYQESLAESLGLPVKYVLNWFTNKRYRCKKADVHTERVPRMTSRDNPNTERAPRTRSRSNPNLKTEVDEPPCKLIKQEPLEDVSTARVKQVKNTVKVKQEINDDMEEHNVKIKKELPDEDVLKVFQPVKIKQEPYETDRMKEYMKIFMNTNACMELRDMVTKRAHILGKTGGEGTSASQDEESTVINPSVSHPEPTTSGIQEGREPLISVKQEPPDSFDDDDDDNDAENGYDSENDMKLVNNSKNKRNSETRVTKNGARIIRVFSQDGIPKITKYYSTETQRAVLESVFVEHKFPDNELQERLAKELDLPLKFILRWFVNRRVKARRCGETVYLTKKQRVSSKSNESSTGSGEPSLKPSDSLLKSGDTLLKSNECSLSSSESSTRPDESEIIIPKNIEKPAPVSPTLVKRPSSSRLDNFPYQCGQCKKLFRQDSAFKAHMLIHGINTGKNKKSQTKGTSSDNSAVSEEETENFSCFRCMKTFDDFQSFEHHIQDHVKLPCTKK